MSFAVNEAYVEINRKSFGFIAVNQRNAFETVAYGGCNIVEAQQGVVAGSRFLRGC
mgnify:CR=1 FL=1